MRKIHRLSSLERLEDRIAPAGLVRITLFHGTVTITGDDMNNSITIAPITTGVLEITPAASTMLQFGNAAPTSSAVDVSGYAKDLKVSLGVGSDSVTLGAGNYLHNVTLDGGADANTFNYSGGISIAGSFSVLAKGGGDTINASGDVIVGRDYNLKLGDGSNTITHHVSQFSVGGKLTILGGKSVDMFSFTSTDTIIGRDVSINTGQSSDTLTFSATGALHIYGKLGVIGAQLGQVTTGSGAGVINHSDFTVTAGNLFTVNGNVSFTTINEGSGISFGGTNRTEFGGNLKVTTGAASTIGFNSASDSVLGNVTFKTKGATTLNMQPSGDYFVGGNFSYTGDKGADGINMVAMGTIVGNATFSLGDGNMQTLNLGGASNVAANILGSLTITSAETLPPPATPAFPGTTSTTTLALLFVGGKFSLATGASADTINIDDLTIKGASKISTGANADHLNVETLGLSANTIFVGALTASLGAGDDDATFGVSGSGNAVTFTVQSTLDAGAGTDTVKKAAGALLTVKNAEAS